MSACIPFLSPFVCPHAVSYSLPYPTHPLLAPIPTFLPAALLRPIGRGRRGRPRLFSRRLALDLLTHTCIRERRHVGGQRLQHTALSTREAAAADGRSDGATAAAAQRRVAMSPRGGDGRFARWGRRLRELYPLDRRARLAHERGRERMCLRSGVKGMVGTL